MQHLRRQYDVSVSICTGEILLDNVFYVSQIHESFYILGNEYLGANNIYHLLHPEIQLASAFLCGFIIGTLLPEIILLGVKTLSFACYAEILARETARDHIYVIGENVGTLMMHLHQLYDTGIVIHILTITESAHVCSPSLLCFWQYVVGKDGLEWSLFQEYPVVIHLMIDKWTIYSKGFLVCDEVAFKSQVHTATSGEQRKHTVFLFCLQWLILKTDGNGRFFYFIDYVISIKFRIWLYFVTHIVLP